MAGHPLATWSGFTHQGRAALIAAFDFITNRIPAGDSLDCYLLALEEKEDFAIKKTDGEIVELHQVKVYPTHNEYAKYKDAANRLGGMPPRSAKKYLHSYSEITDWPVSGAPCDLYHYDGSYYYFGKSNSAAGSASMDTYLKNAISRALTKHSVDIKALEIIQFKVEAKLNEKVCEGHTNRIPSTSGFKAEIGLKELISLSEVTEEVHNIQLKEIISVASESFLEFKQSEVFKTASPEHQEIVAEIVFSRILISDLNKFKQILESMNPGSRVGGSFLTHDYYTEAGWQDVFLKILTRVVKEQLDLHNEVLPFYNKSGEFFVPTFITKENPQVEKIRANIMNSLQFEANNIIVKHLPIEESTQTPNFNKIDDEDLEGFPDNKHYGDSEVNKPRTLKFIAMDDAIKILNE